MDVNINTYTEIPTTFSLDSLLQAVDEADLPNISMIPSTGSLNGKFWRQLNLCTFDDKSFFNETGLDATFFFDGALLIESST